MAGLDPAIHVFASAKKVRRGSPGQARWWRAAVFPRRLAARV